MKANTIKQSGHKKLIAIIAAIVVIALVVGIAIGYEKLADLYYEQCVITDVSEQVEITSGKMVKPDVIAENMGIRKGANLAKIDFAAKREEILRKIPTIRSISVTRRLPDKVYIVAEERTPIAKMGVRGQRRVTGRVVDTEGMVFLCQRGTQLLPTISEPLPPGTQPGNKIKGRTLAALQLIETCRERGFSELAVQDVDVSKPDYLLATLGDYSRLKISWEGMDNPSAKSRQDLEGRLSLLTLTIRSRVGTGARTWNATMPGNIFADTQESH